MTSPPADGDSSVRAARSLVDAFLAEDPLWQEWKADAATILDVGDQEVHLVVAVRKSVVTFERISRDHRYLTAEFGQELDAWRFLIMQLGDSWRSARRMRDINPRELGLAPGATLERGPSGYWLTWPGGAAIFYSDLDAIGFSWVARAEPADIAASYRHVNGAPLFDLGPPVEAQGADPPAPRRVMARTDSGYTIENRRSGNVFGTFSSTRGARRYAIMELGRLWRQSHGLKSIWPKQPAPGSRLLQHPQWLPADVERWRSQVPDGLRRDQIQLDRHSGARRHRGQLQPPQRCAAVRPEPAATATGGLTRPAPHPRLSQPAASGGRRRPRRRPPASVGCGRSGGGRGGPRAGHRAGWRRP